MLRFLCTGFQSNSFKNQVLIDKRFSFLNFSASLDTRRFQKCEVKESLVRNPSVPWNFAKNDTPLSITLSRFGWGKGGRHSVGGKPDNDYPPL